MEKKLATDELKSLFKAIPKTELHAHFAATLPLSFVDRINSYRQAGIVIPEKYKGLDDFANFYGKLYGRQELNEQQLQEGSYLICMEAAEHNVKYIEIRFAAILNALSDERICKALMAGMLKARHELEKEGFFQRSGIILTLLRLEDAYQREEFDEKLKYLDEMLAHSSHQIVGLDIAGDEKSMALDSYECQAYMRLARKHSLSLTVHAGEVPNEEHKQYIAIESIRKAIANGANRIGHGIHVTDSPELVKLAVDHDICFEVCPSSNVIIGNVDIWENLPIRKMIEAGIKVSICTDDKAILNTDYSQEFVKLYENNLITKWRDIKTLVLNGVKYSFTSKLLKSILLTQFQGELANIERNSRFSKIIADHLV